MTCWECIAFFRVMGASSSSGYFWHFPKTWGRITACCSCKIVYNWFASVRTQTAAKVGALEEAKVGAQANSSKGGGSMLHCLYCQKGLGSMQHCWKLIVNFNSLEYRLTETWHFNWILPSSFLRNMSSGGNTKNSVNTIFAELLLSVNWNYSTFQSIGCSKELKRWYDNNCSICSI